MEETAMKEIYTAPEMEIIQFDTEDVITTSNFSNGGNAGDHDHRDFDNYDYYNINNNNVHDYHHYDNYYDHSYRTSGNPRRCKRRRSGRFLGRCIDTQTVR